MSSLRQRVRTALRWLLGPALRAVDRRIARRVQGFEDRISHAERDIDALRSYGQLLAGSLSPTADSGLSPAAQVAPEASEAIVPAKIPTAPNGRVRFVDRLSCPVCRTDVEVVPELVTTDGRVKRGHVPCPTCQTVVGVVRDFRIDFRTPGVRPASSGPARVIPPVGELRLQYDDERVRRSGDWVSWDDRYAISHGSVTDSLEYRGTFTDALVHMVIHDRGGIVDFFVDGRHAGTADLYCGDWFVMPFTMVSDLPFEEHEIRIIPRGTKNAASAGCDVFFGELVLLGPRTDPAFGEAKPLNRGNPYTPVFERYISQVPEGELILEVGGGERRRLRPGYVNLEYMSVESADVFGDIQHLPFRDGSFTLALAQAVFEHVTDPYAAAAELVRVARPGGFVVIDAAFMQPLHAAPHHYFNITPMGMTELLNKSCTIVEVDHYDGLAGTVDWMLKSVGGPSKVSDEEYARVIAGIRAIEKKMSHEEFRAAASGFWVVARKPD